MNTVVEYFGIGKFGRPLQTICPTCNVRYGKCVTKSGRKASMEHFTRLYPPNMRRKLREIRANKTR